MMGASKLSSLLNFNNTLIVAVKAQDGDRRSESRDSRSYLCRFHWWTACPGCPTLDGHPLHPGGEHRPLHSPRCAGRLHHPDSGRPHRHLLETGQHHLREERGPLLPLRKVQHSPLHQEDLPEDHHDCPRPPNLHGHQLETTSRTGSLAPYPMSLLLSVHLVMTSHQPHPWHQIHPMSQDLREKINNLKKMTPLVPVISLALRRTPRRGTSEQERSGCVPLK